MNFVFGEKLKKHIISIIMKCLYKLLIYIAFAILGLCLLATSCSDILDAHREWIEKGETIYVGKLDSLRVRSGMHRVEIVGDTRYIRTAVTCKVAWNEEERLFALSDIVAEDGKARIIIDDLERGSYYFYVITYDDTGNRSLVSEVYGQVYGTEDLLVQSPVRIEDMVTLQDGTIELHWNNADATYIVVTYETADGQAETITIEELNGVTVLDSWKKGGSISVQTVISKEDDLDPLVLDPVVYTFPEKGDYELDKSMFSVVSLPTDIVGNAYGAKGVQGIWDGIWGGPTDPSGQGYNPNCYHSADGEGVPHHITFDIGVKAHLYKVWIAGRTDGVELRWNPKRWQLWGREDLNGAETMLPSADPGWEAEAVEKGWKLLGEFTCTDDTINEFVIEDAPAGMRYLRFRPVEVVGGTGTGVYCCVSEITLWADDVEVGN